MKFLTKLRIEEVAKEMLNCNTFILIYTLLKTLRETLKLSILITTNYTFQLQVYHNS